MMKVDANIRLK